MGLDRIALAAVLIALTLDGCARARAEQPDAGSIYLRGYEIDPPLKTYPVSFMDLGVEQWRATPAKVITITKAGRDAGWRCE